MPELNDEESYLVATVRQFIDREVKPSAREVEDADTYPERWIEQMKQIGIYGLAVPEEYGGMPVSMPCYVRVTEELARGWMSLAGAMGGHTVVATLLAQFGTEEQKRTHLPRLATGEIRATMALTEPGGGSDLQNMSTVARTDGNELVITGAKTFITNARRSGLIALLCKTDPEATSRHRGMSIVLVEHGPGLTVSRDLPKLGYKGVETCELAFDGYRTPADRVLGGEPGRGFAQMMKGPRDGPHPGRQPGAGRRGGGDADRAGRGPHPRRVRLLDRVRHRAVLPGRPADDRRRGDQRDPAQRHRLAVGGAGWPGMRRGRI